MTVLFAQVSSIGQVPNISGLGLGLTQQSPAIVYFNTNNTLAQVLVSGFLNLAVQRFQLVVNNYQMALVYTTDSGDVWLRVLVTTTAGVNTYSLVQPVVATGTFSVIDNGFGTAAAPSYSFTGRTNLGMYSAAANALDFAVNGVKIGEFLTTGFTVGGNITAGATGTAGVLTSFPATVTNGSLILAAANAGGAFNTTISNGTMGQSTVYTLGDIGAATGGVVVATTAALMKSVKGAAAAGGAAAQSFSDAFCTSASNIVGNWATQATPASVLTIVAGNGSFVVTSSANAGVGTFNYVIYK